MNEIDCFLKNEFGNSMGAEFGITNVLELWVRDDADFHKAADILKQMKEAEQGVAWICGKCDENNEANFEICWKCQVERPLAV